MNNVITLKDFRENVAKYAERVENGDSLIIMKRSRPLFRIAPVDEGVWEEVIDFTKVKRGGIKIEDLLARL